MLDNADGSETNSWETVFNGHLQKDLYHLNADIGCCLEHLPGEMEDKDWWKKKFKEIFALSATWGWKRNIFGSIEKFMAKSQKRNGRF